MQTVETGVLEMAKGAILEQVTNEFTKIMGNILDLNTDPKKPRKLTINLTFKADENRELVTYEAQAKSTLAPVMPVSAKIVLEEKDGKPIAKELTRDDPNQVHMFDEDEKVNVIKLTVGGTK